MMLTRQDRPHPAPGIDPTPLQALLCRAGLAVAVVDGDGCLSMLSPRLQRLLQRPFVPVPAASLAEVLNLHTEAGDRLLLPRGVPILRALRGEVVQDALVTHAFMNEFRIHTERVLTVLPRS